jgi:hypothetical protein
MYSLYMSTPERYRVEALAVASNIYADNDFTFQ